jgi:hypothetical protein
MAKERGSIFTDNIHICQDWSQITSEFDSSLKPIPNREEGDLVRQGWVFRVHKRENYPLEPSIERVHPYTEWDWAEHKILREFQSKAQLHMDAKQLPPTTSEHKLSWLAIMQHYGAPTRLLDLGVPTLRRRPNAPADRAAADLHGCGNSSRYRNRRSGIGL